MFTTKKDTKKALQMQSFNFYCFMSQTGASSSNPKLY